MKKYAFLFAAILIVVLGVAVMCITASNTITSVVSLSQKIPENSRIIKIDLNSATASDLKIIPGIGDALAQKIITYRRENGPFHTVEDLLNVSGIGQETYKNIVDYLTVGGQS